MNPPAALFRRGLASLCPKVLGSEFSNTLIDGKFGRKQSTNPMHEYHIGFEYAQPPIPSTTIALLSSPTEADTIDPTNFCIELFSGDKKVGFLSAGLYGIEGALSDTHYDDEARQEALYTADVYIDIHLPIPGNVQSSYLAMHYDEFEQRMRDLGLSSVYEPKFVAVWTAEFLRLNVAQALPA